jgi:DNA-binding SARP family transcriptional activator
MLAHQYGGAGVFIWEAMKARASPAEVSTRLRLYLFGHFRIESETRPVHLPTRKVESLLAYLVLRSEDHTREQLAALFWGDVTDTQARASLRNALAILRRQLGEELLVTDCDTVQLNPAFPWVDALRFRVQATQFPSALARPQRS